MEWVCCGPPMAYGIGVAPSILTYTKTLLVFLVYTALMTTLLFTIIKDTAFISKALMGTELGVISDGLRPPDTICQWLKERP